MTYDADAIVIGAGLAGLVAATELTDAGKRVIIVDQEPEQTLGGQAWRSFGGLFFVNSPEQRRLRIKDSYELALQDWMGSAGFDREEDHWPRKWAEAYVDFAAGEKRSWLHAQGMRWFPIVGWAERGGSLATGHGNSVPRFHITWGTGLGVVEPFVRRAREAEQKGLLSFRFRHRVTSLGTNGGIVDSVEGEVLEPSNVKRSEPSSRVVASSFILRAQVIVVCSGGMGANHDLVRKNWPKRLGEAPKRLISGVPDHVDGLMLGISEQSGAHLINCDRMWHYVEGVHNWNPIWSRHAIRILPGPSSLWFDANGNRLPAPCLPGFDTLATLSHIMKTGYDYSWFILNETIVKKEFTLSGSEQNPDFTSKSWRQVLKRATGGIPSPVKAFLDKGEDFIVENNLTDLVRRMNALSRDNLIDEQKLHAQIAARDREVENTYTKDAQITAIRGARNYIGDKLVRVVPPHKILDPKHGRLIAVRLNILTRKSLGGIETDLNARVLKQGGEPLPGVYAAGEAAGFGGGGVHGYNSLEGTFLGGCIFSGRIAGRAAAKVV